MAAAYRVVVSSLNYYSSVVIDRRAQNAVHYCTGPCQLLTHGLDCTPAHRSACPELLDTTLGPMPAAAAQPTAAHRLLGKFTALGNRGFLGGGAEAMMEECYQALQGVSRGRKGLAVQAFSGSLKDITGEAINLASGKVKEFSHDRDRVSSGHSLFRRGRKVRSDPLLRRSSDLDVLLGRFSAGNEENRPPFKLPPSEDQLGLEPRVGSTGLRLSDAVEEGLVARILEKAKLEGGAPTQDMRACLEILLRCSEDLKRCTDIIRQCCIHRKSAGDGIDYGGPEMAYRSAMARLSGYLKKLPLGFGFGAEQGQAWRLEQGDVAELLRGLQRLQQGPHSSVFGDDLPPRYEDVVRSPPELGDLPSHPLPPPSQPEVPAAPSMPMEKDVEPAPDMQELEPPSPSASLPKQDSQRGKVTATIQLNCPESLSFVSSTAVAMKKPSSITMATEEPLYIEEDGDEIVSRGVQEEGLFSQAPAEVNGVDTPKPGVNNSLSMRAANQMQVPNEERGSENLMVNQGHAWVGGSSRSDSDEIDKLLTDLECLSRSIAKEPPAKVRGLEQRNGSQQPGAPPRPPARARQDPLRDVGNGEDGDGDLLQRILDSIESLAQELVENGAARAAGMGGVGPLSKQTEVIRILQDTMTAPAEPETRDSSTSSHALGATPTHQNTPDLTPMRGPRSSLLIQQTPEVIRIQTKPVEEPVAAHTAQAPRPSSEHDPPIPAATSPPPHTASPPPAHHDPPYAPVSINIPRFYFPDGLPPDSSSDFSQTIGKIEAAFADLQDQKADIYDMGKIAKVCGCPLYWKSVLFHGTGGDRTGSVSARAFITTWRKLLHCCYDDAAKFFHLLAKPGCRYMEQDDFIPLLQDIVETHPGLTFLKDAPEFHSRYITTVIQRIFYTVNRSWTGRITTTELRRSNFLQTLALLEEEDDINLITDYFSYEHFYVIYCKFWELDTDHDLFIDQKDLARYNDHASSNRIIERLFSGAVMKGGSVQREGKMSYAEFVWYLISEEDKRSLTSIEYWFRCMDLDGDGVLSMYELQFFYKEQCERMETMGIEPLPFNDLLCQMLDLVKPERAGKIMLGDLKRCQMAHIFYNTFFNLEKYLDHEQRDPFSVQKDMDSDLPEPSDWEKFAAEEYEVLVAEDTTSDHPAEGSFEEDCESAERAVTQETGRKAAETEQIVISNLSV